MPRLVRFRSVQLLRVIAAVAVVVLHALAFVRDRLDPSVPLLFEGGGRVWMFFAISGFVTALVLRRDPGRSAVRFGLGRVARLVPLYWLMTTIKLLFVITSPSLLVAGTWDWLAVAESYALVPTHDESGAVHPLWGVGWTLYFEMAFAALVVTALALRLDPIRFASSAFVALACTSLLVPEAAPAWTTYATPNVLVFVSGMVLADTLSHRRIARSCGQLTAVTALYVGLTIVERPEAAVNDCLTFIGVQVLFVGVVSAERWVAPRLPRWLDVLADSSYSLYLTHPLIGPAVPTAFALVGLTGGIWTWSCFALTVLVPVVASPLVHRFVERPLTRLAQRAVLRPRVPEPELRPSGTGSVPLPR